MKTSLDCLPCFIRQTLEAARIASPDPAVHEQIARELLGWASRMDFNQPPPALAQRVHRRLRELTGLADPYRPVKDRQNAMALRLMPEVRKEIASSQDPLLMAVRLAIAGNIIDSGVNGNINEADIRLAIRRVFACPFQGDIEQFRRAVSGARRILYLADNAGEIIFDRLLLELLPRNRTLLAVRGAPAINDATLADAHAAGLSELVEIIDNGSDAPGTILADCSAEFRRQFNDADLIVAKGQGNFETLNEVDHNIFFLFQVKCEPVSRHTGLPVGTHALLRSNASSKI